MGVKERRGREEQARLETIVAAAERVFAGKGYFHARMEDVAEAAELAKGTLYYYFKSKDEIFVHILERESEKVRAEIRSRMTGTDSLLGLLEMWIDFYLDYFEKNQGYLRMFLPCMGGMVRFEDEEAGRRLLRNSEHWRELRETLKARLAGERCPFGPDEMLKFLKTLQLGMGFKLLQGDKAEARAAGRFFLDMMKRVMEAKS
jgi:AcrR family transcriptional regulator